MPEKFGARLRQRRVDQKISLGAIAQHTKIKLSLLEDLERDDVSRWPTGIFRRAYVRTYAQAIGLDPEVTLREFLEVYPEPEKVFTAALEEALAADRARVNASAPGRLRNIVGSALGSLSLFRRAPAVEERVVPSNVQVARHEAPKGQDEKIVAVAYSTHGLAWAETADDAGIEFPVPEVRPPLTEPPDVTEAAQEGVAVELAPAIKDMTEAHPVEQPKPNGGSAAVPAYPDLPGLARLCTDFGRLDGPEYLPLLLEESARLLDATGLIVWIWDESVDKLKPALAHGYSDKVLAHLPRVGRDADNVTAAAYRSAETCTIRGGDHASGALVVPMMTPTGCAGVLAIELQPGVEQTDAGAAVARIIAASLAQLVARLETVAAETGAETAAPAAEEMAAPVPRTRFAN